MSHQPPELLNGLTPDQVDRVLEVGTRLIVASGETLFRLGDAADRLFLIERGRIRLTLPMRVRGNEENLLVEERMAGQAVGWSALIHPYRFTLTASAPLETELIALPREALRQQFSADPEIGYRVAINLASVIGQRLQLFQTMWVREMQRTVETRCA